MALKKKSNKKNPVLSTASSYRFVTERPVAVIMTALAVIVFGWASYNKLALNLMPDISYPTLTIRTEYEGGAPEEVENLISRPVEQTLAVARNKTKISSISRAGWSDVIIEFTWDTDMNTATQDVRELLEQFIPPDGAKKPLVLRYDPTLDPIMRLGLYNAKDTSQNTLFILREIAEEEIKRDLEAISGIAAVKVKGGLEEEIIVDLNEKVLTSLGLDINRVNSRLAAENVNLAGGNLEEGDTEYMVRTLNLFLSVEEIENLIVERLNNADIRLKDIGSVYQSHKEREVITRVNGSESVELEIYKEADANIVQLAESVKERVFGTVAQQMELQRYIEQQKKNEAQAAKKTAVNQQKSKQSAKNGEQEQILRRPDYVKATLPEGVDMALLSDQSTYIKNSLDEVKSTAVLGGILAVAILFFFLKSGYTTFIIALSIPLSIVATFASMHLFKVTLNMMSLGGLALGIGMLVDNSIVVLESIFRCREEGDSVNEAAVRGASEVGTAVTASTLTTVAVFLPIVFVEGIAGQLFGDLSLTVVFSLMMSLIVAVYFVPMMASRDFRSYSQKGRIKSKLLASTIKTNLNDKLKKRGLIVTSAADTGGYEEEPSDKSFKDSIVKAGIYCLAIGAAVLEVLRKGFSIFFAMVLLFIKSFLLLILSPLHILITFILLIVKRKLVVRSPLIRFAEWHKLTIKLLHYDMNTTWENLLHYHSYGSFSQKAVEYAEKPGKTVAKFKKDLKRGIFRKIAGSLLLFGKLFGNLFLILFFLPIWLLLNLVGQIFLKIGLLFTILIMLLAVSLVDIFTFILRGLLAPFLYGFDISFRYIKERYPVWINSALDNKKVVVLGSAGVFLFAVFVIVPQLGSELLPEMHQGEFNVQMRMPVGTPLESTDEHTTPIDNYIGTLDGIAMRATVIGAEKTSSTTSDEGEHTSKITIRLADKGNLIEQEEKLIEEIRQKVAQIPQIEINIARPVLFSFKTPIEVEIKGYNLKTLKEISRRAVEEISGIDGIFDVRSNIQPGNPEIQLIYDREKLAKYNLDIAQVAGIVRNKVLGYVPTKFNKEDKKVEIRVRIQDEDRNTIEELKQINISPSTEIPIPLSAIADIKLEEGPAEIRRVEQQRTAVISANVTGLDLGSAGREVLNKLKNIQLPPDMFLDISGQNKEMEVSMKSLTFAMFLAVFLVYTVMAMLFESIIQPLIILLTIPLALIGVIIVLWIGGIPISVMVGIGAIVLVGIVVNNAIVLVDYTNTLRKRGYSLRESVINAGKIRMRPILMTTATTVLGLLPMALGLGEGAEIRTPLAWTVIAGLTMSTVLTLIVIPTIYVMVTEKFEKKSKVTE